MDSYQPNSDLKLVDNIYKTRIEGLFFINHDSHPDDRGFFTELTLIPQLNQIDGIDLQIRQINHAHSKENVTRGFHAENWNKLIHVISGAAFCALADVRPESSSFGQVETFILGGHDHKYLDGSLYISAGIANSTCAIKGPLEYLYHVDQLYQDRDKTGDMAISLFDPDLDVSWPISKEQMILSDRDLQAITLREKFPKKFK